ncbi:MAG: hypothetical protein LBK82_13115, partial [Planctomycetaceae bacterium]|nr:hypothetical protein [Planctomycetaceae bacterium]
NQINDGNSLLPTLSESDCQPKTGAMSALPTQPFSERLPTSVCRLPTSVCRLPTSVCRLPTSIYRLPTSVCRLPTRLFA